jgi:putative transcriptional regulator
MDMMHLQRKTDIKPAAGKLLIAEPFLTDPGFARTVILLCEHGEHGSVGFVLNRLSEHKLTDLLPEFQAQVLPIFDGGPVQKDTLHMIHSMPNEMGGHEILPGMYWGGSYTDLSRMMESNTCNPNNIKLFLGYSGWDAGQLEQELEENAWLVADNFDQLIFGTPAKQVWQNAVRSLGHAFAYMANMPMHPQMN